MLHFFVLLAAKIPENAVSYSFALFEKNKIKFSAEKHGITIMKSSHFNTGK